MEIVSKPEISWVSNQSQDFYYNIFYQVAATFGSVYGVQLHKIGIVLDFLSYLSLFLGILDLLSLPTDGVGSKQDQLLLFIILSPIFLCAIDDVLGCRR
jgi:hypothetical protein